MAIVLQCSLRQGAKGQDTKGKVGAKPIVLGPKTHSNIPNEDLPPPRDLIWLSTYCPPLYSVLCRNQPGA